MTTNQAEQPKSYQSELSLKNRIVRVLWALVYLSLFRISPKIFFSWRAFLLRLFGAKIGRNTKIYNSVEFFIPSQTTIGDACIIGPHVKFYNVGRISIGDRSIVSQHVHLCTATHDFRSPNFALIVSPITIGVNVWIAADAFICPAVNIDNHSVIGARSVVTKDVQECEVVAGNPAKRIAQCTERKMH